MPFWTFRKPAPEPLTPEQLRSRLIETAANGNRRQLRSLCRQYREQIATQVDFLVVSRPDEGVGDLLDQRANLSRARIDLER